MRLPLCVPLGLLIAVLGCSKKEPDPQPESVAPTAFDAASPAVSSPAPIASAPPSASAAAAPIATPPAPVAAASARVDGQADGGPTCGTKPLPDCPLQGWMKRNTSAAMTANDLPALGFAFDQMIPLGPPGYTNWASISRDGAAAARIGDMSAVKAACRGCHDQYRNKYRTELRAHPLP